MTLGNAHPTVLIVEDEWIVRWHTREVFERSGFDVLEAACADEALTILAARPDVSALFTDINMPGSLDGLQLARRAHERYPAIKLIITSGKSAPSREEIPDDGIFVSKPYSADSLVRQVSNALTQSG